jgi:hypothetical protein
MHSSAASALGEAGAVTVPFSDAPLGCVLGAHEWRTTWQDEEGPVPVCGACGTTEWPAVRERRMLGAALRDAVRRIR